MQGLPGAELIGKGLADLARNEETIESLLVSIGSPKLRAVGVPVGPAFDDPEHRLYVLLGREHGDNTHGRYNALVRLLVSYERALACAPVDASRLRAFLDELSRAAFLAMTTGSPPYGVSTEVSRDEPRPVAPKNRNDGSWESCGDEDPKTRHP